MSKSSDQDMKNLRSIIANCDDEQINMIVGMIKNRRNAISAEVKSSLGTGIKVYWNSKYGTVKNGVIVRIKQKYVEVKETVDGKDAGMWNIPASMLKVV